MNIHNDVKNSLPANEELQKHGVKMLVVIVSRGDEGKVTRYLREHHFMVQFTCMAEGTQGSYILDMLGLGSVDRAVVVCISPGFRIDPALKKTEKDLHLRKAGKGIAFTIPLAGISLPKFTAQSENTHLISRLLKNMEYEVDKMNNDITHSIILALVNQGNSEEVVEVAKAAGATGGTVINARRTGAEDAVKFFGMTVQAEKELIAILTQRENKQAIMDAIDKSFGMNSPAHGIIVSVPVDGVAGIEE